MRRIIIHHDDLGFDETMNEAFLDLPYRTGSIIAAAPAAESLCEMVLKESFDLGVHLTLTSDVPKRRIPPLSRQIQVMTGRSALFPTTRAAWDAVSVTDALAEFRCQVRWVKARGVDITHIDAHMACTYRPDILAKLPALITEIGVSNGISSAFSWPGLPNPLARVAERFPELYDIMSDLTIRRLRLIDPYLLDPSTKTTTLATLLGELPDGDYQLIHHSCVPTRRSVFSDYDIRVSDYRALRSAELHDVLHSYEVITHRSLIRTEPLC